MEKFIGTKVVKAKFMNREDFNKFKGWETFAGENPKDEGYLVGYPNANGLFTGPLDYDCQYLSWSPKNIFESAYHRLIGLTFGMAIEAAKLGYKIARSGWNGKNMFVVYQKGYPDGIPCNKQTAEAFGMQEGELFKVRPYLQMRCADGTHQMWLASQSDILEEDWFIVE